MARVIPETAHTDVIELEDGETIELEYAYKIDGDGPAAYIVTPREGRRMYDEAVREYMGMSGEEFLRRWDAGEFHELYDKPGYWYVGYLVDIRSFGEQED
jgi:hypothetical protein